MKTGSQRRKNGRELGLIRSAELQLGWGVPLILDQRFIRFQLMKPLTRRDMQGNTCTVITAVRIPPQRKTWESQPREIHRHLTRKGLAGYYVGWLGRRSIDSGRNVI